MFLIFYLRISDVTSLSVYPDGIDSYVAPTKPYIPILSRYGVHRYGNHFTLPPSQRGLIQDISESGEESHNSPISPDYSYTKPLRQNFQTPKEYRLDSGVEYHDNSAIDIWCNIESESTVEIKECYFTSPDDSRYLIRDDKFLTLNNYNTSGWIDSPTSNIIIMMYIILR